MSNKTLGLDSLGMIEMKVGFIFEWVLTGHPVCSIDPLEPTTVNYKFSEFGSFKGGLLRIIVWQNNTTALKEANSVAAGSKWKAAMAKHSLSFLFLSVLFFASQESKQW